MANTLDENVVESLNDVTKKISSIIDQLYDTMQELSEIKEAIEIKKNQ